MAVKIGADEDWELSKVTQALNGYHFYTDVWNDQPLLHTFIITQVLKHISPTILGARLVTSVFTIVLLASVFAIAFRVNGLSVATLATVLLICSPGFLELSSSCMVEIPALAPAVAALAVLRWTDEKGARIEHSERSSPSPQPSPLGRGSRVGALLENWWAAPAIAGLLFGISFQIKFINVVLLPIAALIIWLQTRVMPPHPYPLPRWGRGMVIFGGSLLVTFLAITFALGADGYWLQLKQSWAAHFASTKSFEYGSPNDHPFEWSTYLKNWDMTIPAVIGIIFCLGKGRPHPKPSPESRKGVLLLIPVAWFTSELVIFGFHKPWWSYYYIHNAIPLCWCAAIGIATVVQRIAMSRRLPAILLASVCGVLMAAWMGARIYLQISTIRSSPRIYSSLVIRETERYKPFTKFMYTDEPAYSFHTGIPMPPSLAVVTLKRLWSGDMERSNSCLLTRPSQPTSAILPFL